jgi:hypothetical protein
MEMRGAASPACGALPGPKLPRPRPRTGVGRGAREEARVQRLLRQRHVGGVVGAGQHRHRQRRGQLGHHHVHVAGGGGAGGFRSCRKAGSRLGACLRSGVWWQAPGLVKV